MAINLENGYKELKSHVGHDLACVSYAEGNNVAIQCETCGIVLIDFNKEGIEEQSQLGFYSLEESQKEEYRALDFQYNPDDCENFTNLLREETGVDTLQAFLWDKGWKNARSISKNWYINMYEWGEDNYIAKLLAISPKGNIVYFYVHNEDRKSKIVNIEYDYELID